MSQHVFTLLFPLDSGRAAVALAAVSEPHVSPCSAVCSWLSQGNYFPTSLLVSSVFFGVDKLLDRALERAS